MDHGKAVQRGTLTMRCLREDKVLFTYALELNQDGGTLTVEGEEPIEVHLVERIDDGELVLRGERQVKMVDKFARDSIRSRLDAFCQNHCLKPGQECQMRKPRLEAE